MLVRTILALFVYVLGLVALVIWSFSGLLGDAPREDWALMIVLPFAWAFSYWPMLGSILMIARIRGLQRTLEGIAAELKNGTDPSPDKLDELEDLAVDLAARENQLPQFIVRPVIRRVLARMLRDRKRREEITQGQPDAAS